MRYLIISNIYLKETIEINVCSSIEIVTRVCNKALTKLAKYYSKTKELDDTLYNLVNILNSTQKLSFYKMWNKKNNNNAINYKTKYKIEFKIYFRRHYDLIASLRAKAQRANIAKEIMQYNNACDLLLTLL